MSPTTDLIPASSTTTGRRTALQAIAALGLGWLGATQTPEAGVARKKKHKHGKKKRRHQGGKTSPSPVPAPPDPGTPDPQICPADTFRFEDRCALSCDTGCPGGSCVTTVEGVAFCGQLIASCADIPTVCSGHEVCGAQELCVQTICGDPTAPLENRCMPVLA